MVVGVSNKIIFMAIYLAKSNTMMQKENEITILKVVNYGLKHCDSHQILKIIPIKVFTNSK